jgi:Uma2 family endonuclease
MPRSSAAIKLPSSQQLTYEDYCHLPNDGKRYEIIAGELYVSPAPRILHQLVSGRLFFHLYGYVSAHDLGLVLSAPTDIVFSRINIVQPDLIFIAKAHLHIVTETNIKGALDLLIEVLSPSTVDVDRDIKRKLYARFGVKEYWIVHPEERFAEVYRARQRQFPPRPRIIRDTLESPLLPGLQIGLAELFTPSRSV